MGNLTVFCFESDYINIIHGDCVDGEGCGAMAGTHSGDGYGGGSCHYWEPDWQGDGCGSEGVAGDGYGDCSEGINGDGWSQPGSVDGDGTGVAS